MAASRINMLLSGVLFVFLFAGLSDALALTTSRQDEAKRKEIKNSCDPDIYCPGDNFNRTNIVGQHVVQCDNAPQPRDSCCLPQEKHFACYNIMVDYQYLNFDHSSPSKDTDFNSLCAMLVKLYGYEAGNFANAIRDGSKGGYIRYNFGVFTKLESASSEHIKDLACGVKGDWPGKPKPRTTTTTTTTTPAPEPAEPASKPDEQPEVINTEN